MGCLPNEILLQIFDLAFAPPEPTSDAYRVDYRPMLACSLVCRQWHQCTESYLWRNANFLCTSGTHDGEDTICQYKLPRFGMSLQTSATCDMPLGNLVTVLSMEIGTQYISDYNEQGLLSGSFTVIKHVDPLSFAHVVAMCPRLLRLHITVHHEITSADGFDSECLYLLRKAIRLEHLSLDDRHNGTGVTAQLLSTWRRLRTLRVRMLRFSTRAVPVYMALEALHLERAPSPAFVTYLLYSHSIIKTITLELLDDYTQCFLTFRASLRELMVRRHREFEEDSPARQAYLAKLELPKLERLRVFVIDQLTDPGLLEMLPASIDTFGFNPQHTRDPDIILGHLRKRPNVRTLMMPWRARTDPDTRTTVQPLREYCRLNSVRLEFASLVIWEPTNWNTPTLYENGTSTPPI